MPDAAVTLLTPAPVPSDLAVPVQPGGTVTLFRDNHWSPDSNNQLVLSTDDYLERVRHSIAGTNMQDAATWVAFNLPVGTVVTLMDNATPADDGIQPWDLRDCGRCVDLVGTGTTVAVDLVACNMNDCVSAFFWRKVNLDVGAIELFDDDDFKGNRTTLFLSEWPYGKAHSIDRWWLAGRVSSARWKSLQDTQSAGLFSTADGTTGTRYQNIFAWARNKEIASLSREFFNDSMRGFQWQGLEPRKESIPVISISPNLQDPESISDVHTVNNLASELPQKVTLAVKNTDAQTLTVTVTNTHVVGLKVTATATYGSPGIASGSLAIELSYTYTHTDTTQTTSTHTIELDVTQEYTVPKRSRYE